MHKKILQIFFFVMLMFPLCKCFAQYAVEQAEDSVRFSPAPGNLTVDARKIPDTVVNNLKKDDDYWYADVTPEKKDVVQTTQGSSIFDKKWFRILMWIIVVGGFIAVVIWYLTSSNILLFRKAARKINHDDEEEISEDIFSLDYEREIQRALSEKNYRLAVRLMYLQTLKRLSEKNKIRYTHERTNSDYLMELFNTRYYTDFFRLTRNFEYTWYGQFDLSPEAFSMMQRDFNRFKSELS